MRVLVTGGTSFILAPLVRELAACGDEVRLLLREESSLRRLGGVRYRACEGDIRDQHAVARAAYGCDAVIHGAYAPVSASGREVLDIAVTGMGNVLRACELHGVRDLMLISSPRALFSSDEFYGLGKRVSERMAEAWLNSGVLDRVLVARIYNAYGPDMGTDHVIPQIILMMLDLWRKKPSGVIRFPVKGSGQDVRSFIWTEDCTAQLAALFRYRVPGFSIQDVGDPGMELTVSHLAFWISRCLNCDITVIADNTASASVQLPYPEPEFDFISKDFMSGLRETVAWYRENGVFHDGTQ